MAPEGVAFTQSAHAVHPTEQYFLTLLLYHDWNRQERSDGLWEPWRLSFWDRLLRSYRNLYTFLHPLLNAVCSYVMHQRTRLTQVPAPDTHPGRLLIHYRSLLLHCSPGYHCKQLFQSLFFTAFTMHYCDHRFRCRAVTP